MSAKEDRNLPGKEKPPLPLNYYNLKNMGLSGKKIRKGNNSSLLENKQNRMQQSTRQELKFPTCSGLVCQYLLQLLPQPAGGAAGNTPGQQGALQYRGSPSGGDGGLDTSKKVVRMLPLHTLRAWNQLPPAEEAAVVVGIL